jgi:hypothetical protein
MRTSRGYLRILLAVLALVVLGYGAVRALSGSPGSDRAAPRPTPSTDAPAPTDEPVPGPSASAGPSPSASPHPARTSPRPTPRASTSSSAAPVIYRVRNDDLCGYIDFTPVNNLSNPPGTPSVFSEHIDKSGGDVVYICVGSSGSVSIKDVDVADYHDAARASAAYVEAKSYAPPGSQRIDGAGTDAYGYVWNSTSYQVVALAGNITFRITLTPRTTPAPGTDHLGAAATALTRSTIPKLSR